MPRPKPVEALIELICDRLDEAAEEAESLGYTYDNDFWCWLTRKLLPERYGEPSVDPVPIPALFSDRDSRAEYYALRASGGFRPFSPRDPSKPPSDEPVEYTKRVYTTQVDE